MSDAASIDLPRWAVVSEKRRAHIGRVTALLERWAASSGLDAEERRAWRDAGLLHDALRDETPDRLRALVGDAAEQFGGASAPIEILHGPAAAARLEAEGEHRRGLLDAIRYHTVGYGAWDRVGRALYMADFLEPGRKFAQADRAFLAAQVPHDFDGVFRQVVRMRLEWGLREGKLLYPSTVAMWNAVQDA